MNRDYLKELGIDVNKSENWLHQRCLSNLKYEENEPIEEKRINRWKEQQEKYGIDDRDSWNLDYTMMLNLYEQLRMYQDVTDEFIDLNFHEFTIFGKTRTEGEWIKNLIKLIKHCENGDIPEFYKKKNGQSKYPLMEAQKRIWKIYAEISPSLWW